MLNAINKKLDNFDYPYCPDCFTKYEKITKIGQGTFGEVFKAKNKKTKQLVALKKILMENEKEGFPITALREIKILQLLRQENIVHLIEICLTKNAQNKSKPTFYLVFEFCEHDLAGLLSNLAVKFSLGEIKKIMQQLLNGLYFIHSNKILHRDMKAANILITKNGVLKLADFGLARAYSLGNPNSSSAGNNSKGNQASTNVNRYTNRVVTLWYRPPELLLGERNYGPPIDMWGAGCIMAELWTRSPIMQGQSEQHQLNLISQLCGSITPEVWPNCEKLELYNSLSLIKDHRRKVKERLRTYVKDAQALELLDKLLVLDPSKRIDSDESLNHDFFWTDPMPADLAKTLGSHTTSMFEFFAQPGRQQRQNIQPHGQNTHGQGNPMPSKVQQHQPQRSNMPNAPNMLGKLQGGPPMPHKPYHSRPYHQMHRRDNYGVGTNMKKDFNTGPKISSNDDSSSQNLANSQNQPHSSMHHNRYHPYNAGNNSSQNVPNRHHGNNPPHFHQRHGPMNKMAGHDNNPLLPPPHKHTNNPTKEEK